MWLMTPEVAVTVTVPLSATDWRPMVVLALVPVPPPPQLTKPNVRRATDASAQRVLFRAHNRSAIPLKINTGRIRKGQ